MTALLKDISAFFEKISFSWVENVGSDRKHFVHFVRILIYGIHIQKGLKSLSCCMKEPRANDMSQIG